MNEWQKDHYRSIIGEKTLILSHGGFCIQLCCGADSLICTNPFFLQGSHDEADTLIVFHDMSVQGKILVKSRDTDVFVLLLRLANRMNYNQKIIMDVDRLIDITNIARNLDAERSDFTRSLPALHVFTGSDYTSSFLGKGKRRAIEILRNDEIGKYIPALINLSSEGEPDYMTLSSLVCRMYGYPSIDDVDEVRYLMFCRMSGRIKHVS